MLNFRIGGIIAALAFLLSLFLSLISRTSMPMLLVRPLIFAALFFILTLVINVFVSRFLPELMEPLLPDEVSGVPAPGSRINITEDDYTGQYSDDSNVNAFTGARPDESDDNIGDFSEQIGRAHV